ncbi:MAG TPA: hypothetical protein VKT80_15905 [Chloroflexota bacterium]|nr:hypothetical protein [Chloroflexota bacterium]
MLATLVWIGAVLAALIGVYYLIPNVYHVLASPPMVPHYKHAVAFFALAVVLVVAGRFVRNNVATRA